VCVEAIVQPRDDLRGAAHRGFLALLGRCRGYCCDAGGALR
jgi:hypothetical protein